LANHSPLNFGEAIKVLPGTEANENQIGRFFQTFYNGLSREHWAWIPMLMRTPDSLSFSILPMRHLIDNDLMMAIITPRAILVNTFGSGKNTNATYEFYNPSALSHQLSFDQLPIKLCYADVIRPRETTTSGLDWIRVAQLPLDADTADIDLST